MKMNNKYILTLVVLFLLFSCKKKIDAKNENFVYKDIKIYSTAEDTDLRLSLTNNLTFKLGKQPLETEVAIFVNPQKTFQTFMGIGGAITDASAVVFSKLPKDKQKELLEAYYSPKGINYSIIRTSIHSCDFSPKSFTYIEEGDAELKTFSIEADKKFRIPLIKKAISLIGNDLVFYASPWSPPPFMKGKKDMFGGGKLLPKFYQAWANYYIKFIKAYEAEGIPVWGVTIQNEPMAIQRWESCIYTAEEEKDFLKNYLGPTFEKKGLGSKKIVVWDHNRDLATHRANTIFEDPEASKYAWGIGFHWYETWTGAEPNYKSLQSIKESFPTKNLLFTEGCQESFSQENYYRWSNAERYGDAIINDFNNGTVGWTDWNILLDENGGPNHVENFCFAPIHADIKKGELIYTPSYFYIGHFSKFIKPNAVRVSTVASRSTLASTSFKNPDNTMVTIVMNKTNDRIDYKLIVKNNEISLNILPHSIQTLIY